MHVSEMHMRSNMKSKTSLFQHIFCFIVCPNLAAKVDVLLRREISIKVIREKVRAV